MLRAVLKEHHARQRTLPRRPPIEPEPALTDAVAANYVARRAQVAELVDALVSGTSGASREGSSPFLGTKTLVFTQ